MTEKNITLSEKLHYSLRLGGWSKILYPTFLGQIVGSHVRGELLPRFAIPGLVLGLLTLFVIIFFNDLADEKVDKIKRTIHKESSSPKTLTDKLLPKKLVLFLAIFSSLALIGLGAGIETVLGRPYFTFFAFSIFFLNYSYSFWPFKLNYRFGGEFLEALGTGLVLPLYNAYLQSGVLWHLSYLIFFTFFFIALANALCSGVCDRVSDLQGGKKTFSVLIGNRNTVKMILISLTLFPLSMGLLGFFYQKTWMAPSFAFLGLTVFSSAKLLRFKSLLALEESILEQKHFRAKLHDSTKLLSYALLFYLLFLG